MNYNSLTKQELLELVTQQQTLASAVEAKDKEIRTLNEKINELNKQYQGSVKKEEIKRYTEEVEERAKKALDIANRYVNAYRDLMRVMKVNLDVAISHEELLSEKLK